MKIILGTAQMGLDYGVNNISGKIPLEESFKILLLAHKSGLTILDTAEVYGDAHKIIGEFHRKYPYLKFKIITKVPHNVPENLFWIKIQKYLDDLEVNFLEVLMFHSFESLFNNYSLINFFVNFKLKGYIKHIGVSVYTNDQLEYLLNVDEVSVVQLPFNLLDNINIKGELIHKLKAKGKIIHTRSTFLQGLFFKKNNDENVIVQKLNSELRLLKDICIQSNCSMEELALSYCIQQDFIDNVIVGVDSINHLDANIKASSFIIGEESIRLINCIKVKDPNLLNPSLWLKK
jgi:aryl-alcohol dehydrogenase-like predicted oxidoreductase